MKTFVKQMAMKYGDFIKQFDFEIKICANVRYGKYPEDAPIEVTNHHIPSEIIINLTSL